MTMAEPDPTLTHPDVMALAIAAVRGDSSACPLLADALEDAGFTDAAGLAHLRFNGGEHEPNYAARYNASLGRRDLLINILSAVSPVRLGDFVAEYAETALWSSTHYPDGDGEGSEPMDDNHDAGDIDPATLAEMRRECAAFMVAAGELLDDGPDIGAHDFWLTRNSHGAGFWDGDWDIDVDPADRDGNEMGDRGERLTAIAKWFGEVNLFVGDDGKIHHQ